MNKTIYIDHSEKTRSYCLPGGSIAFSDRAENIQELIELMNCYISKYDIQVEIVTRGVKGSRYKAVKIVL